MNYRDIYYYDHYLEILLSRSKQLPFPFKLLELAFILKYEVFKRLCLITGHQILTG